MAAAERKLAAILSADAAGYSRLMGADEEATVASLEACRAIFREHVDAHHGRLIDTAGDSVLSVFASVVEAVRAALAIQEALTACNAAVPGDRQMRFRIGVNLGDIIVRDDGTIYGDGVNVAARLEALAEPGTVCVSETAHMHVEGKGDISFQDLGKHRVKNIARPVRAYRVVADEQSARVALSEARSLSERPSIAVLAFENLSGDPEQEYFADGIAEDLITELSRLRWLQVTARNSSFTYKGQAVDVRKVGRDLGVRYVVEGSVRKGGNRVRIMAQLIDTTTGNHLWAGRYDREISDIFALQDEITETLVGTLQTEVGEVERDRAHRKPPGSLDAWEAYQRGMWHLWQVDPENLTEARRLLRRAVDLDPSFAQPYAAIGFSHFLEVSNMITDSPLEYLDQAFRLASQAVALDDRDAMAHFTLGRLHAFRGEYDAAIAESRIAIDLSPSSASAHYGLGVALWWREQSAEAIAELDTAIRLSPRDPFVWAMIHMRAFARLFLGDFETAVEDAQRAIRHPAASFWPYATLASSLALLGRHQDAKIALDKLLEISPNFTPGAAMAGYFPLTSEALRPHFETWIDGLRKAGLHIPDEPSAAD